MLKIYIYIFLFRSDYLNHVKLTKCWVLSVRRILCNPEVHYSVRKSTPLVHILRQINPVHDPHNLTGWKSILILLCRLYVRLVGGLLLSGFPTRIPYELLLFTIRATCSAHLILIDLITRIIFGEQYRPLSFSSCNVLKSLLPRPSQDQISSSEHYFKTL